MNIFFIRFVVSADCINYICNNNNIFIIRIILETIIININILQYEYLMSLCLFYSKQYT